jgi:hypothetical protein
MRNPGGFAAKLSMEGKRLMKKMFAFIVLAFLAVPFVSFAQSPNSPEKSIEDLSVTDIADESITVLSTEETGVPGYVHEKYAFNCLGDLRLVDYFGPAFDPNDKDIIQFERTMCGRQQNNDYDASSE